MHLYLLRHGQTDWNLAKRLQSRTDIALNATGEQQAALLRDWFETRKLDHDVHIEHAFCSPLGRAKRTAQLAFAERGIETQSDDRLIEIALGEFEGKNEASLRKTRPDAYEQWRNGRFLHPAPGGEEATEVLGRVDSFLSELLTGGIEHAAVVAHQGLNLMMKHLLCPAADRDILESYAQANDEIDLWKVEPASHTSSPGSAAQSPDALLANTRLDAPSARGSRVSRYRL